jgi:hypothetical protein
MKDFEKTIKNIIDDMAAAADLIRDNVREYMEEVYGSSYDNEIWYVLDYIEGCIIEEFGNK